MSSELEIDLYVPPDAVAPLPAVVIVGGYRGRFNRMEWTIACARRIAASGLVAAAYANDDPAADLQNALAQIRTRPEVDASRIALWASSGNVPVALSALRGVRCAALLYGYMLDLDESARQFGFIDPQTRFDEIPNDVPLLIVRAGRDGFAGVNDSIDRFAANALARNLPLTLVNHADGQHGFDLSDDSESTREIVRNVFRFLRFYLDEGTAAPSTSSSARS
jgi:hypothetical protein